LFSGIGGIELGFERAGGFETAWFVECEPYAQAVLKKHWSNVPIYGDIRKIDFTTLPNVDILTGGFPCQDISNAGKRKGITGERSGLWKEYLRAICEVRPKTVFVENVAALVNRGLDVVLRDLAQAGYDAEWDCLSAADIGAPHKRQRFFLIAYPGSSLGNNRMDFNIKHEIQRNKEWSATQNIRQGNGWKRWLIQVNKDVGGKISKSDFFGMDDGISEELDRIKCLGNAVVPQCAEVFAEIIKEKLESENEKEKVK